MKKKSKKGASEICMRKINETVFARDSERMQLKGEGEEERKKRQEEEMASDRLVRVKGIHVKLN